MPTSVARAWRARSSRLGRNARRRCRQLFVERLEGRALLATLPPGFSETAVATGLSSATAMEFAPNGDLWVLEQTGAVKRFRPNNPTADVVGNVTSLGLSSSGERGLLGIAFDPQYATNKQAYLYYTATNPGTHNRISRFTVDDTDATDYFFAGTSTVPADAGSSGTPTQAIIFDLDSLSATNHNGGAIHFGPDGKLYVAVGDNANSTNSQSLATVLGKMLRINSDGTIPADNPFLGATMGKNGAIWALGLRNPFTFTFQPGSGRMFINDVGEVSWEEINDGEAGANYGWPNTEGNTGTPPGSPGTYHPPVYTYAHGGSALQGFAITGGAFYSQAVQQFPAQYAGDYFFADYVNDWINVLDVGTGTVTPFATGALGTVDLRVTGDGSLYYLARDANQVFRVTATLPWAGYAHDAQHTGVSTYASQPLTGIGWQTPVDQAPQYSGGGSLLIHYGSPSVTPANTVIVPVKTGAAGGFMVEGINGATGAVKWTQTTDYILPPHNWVPSYAPTLTPANRLYFAGAGGTVYYMNSPDANGATTSGQLAFFDLANYNASKATYDGTVFINTPITSDSAGNIYFGFQVTGSNPLGLQSGIARIDVNGQGTWISAATAAADPNIVKVVMNAAPALSNDGKTLYVAVSQGNRSSGYLLALNSTTLSPTGKVRLKDPNGNDAALPDDGSASPTVGPNGDVFFGVLENPLPYNHFRGWLLHFSGNLTQTFAPGAFGWDITPSIVPRTMVPSYTGTSSYLLMTKYNNYAGVGGDGVNKLAIVDPSATMIDPVTGNTVMNEVLTIAGVTPDSEITGSFPNAVREWCINAAAVDPQTGSVLANSEDGKLYRWDLSTNTFTEVITLTSGIGEAYTPTIIGVDGTVYAINNATLFAVRSGPSNNPIILDNGQAGYAETGAGWLGWPTGYNGSVRYNSAGLNGATASWQQTGLAAGNYQVQATWNAAPNHTASAVYQIYDGTTLRQTVTVDQRPNPSGASFGGVPFQTLGTVLVNSGALRVVLANSASGDVVADAVRIVPTSPPPPPTVDLNWSSGGLSGVPATATVQTPFTISRTYTNANTTPGGTTPSASSLAYYSSVDAVFGNADDLLLGSELVPAGQAVGTYSGTSPALQFAAAGTYYVFAKLDDGSALSETDETNNVTQAAQQVVVSAPSAPIILDNGQAGYAETGLGWLGWPTGYNGNVRYNSAGPNGATASWQQTGLAAGNYQVQATWNAASNHTSSAVYQIYDGTTLRQTVTVDQRPNPSGASFGGVPFQTLGTVLINSGTLRVVLANSASGDIVADAVRIVSTSPPPPPTVDLNWSSGGLSGVPATATAQSPFTINRTYTISNTTPGGTTPSASSLAYYSSVDAVFGNADDLLLGSELVPAGQAVGTYSGTSPALQIAAAGTYYVFAKLDDGSALPETDETNNVTPAAQQVVVSAPSAPIILDNGGSGYTETGAGWQGWPTGYNGNVRYNSAGPNGATASWQQTGLTAGNYQVQATWNGSFNHTSSAVYQIYDGTTLRQTITVDQRPDPSGASFGGVPFQTLGTVLVNSGTLRVVLSNSASGDIVADAVRIVPL